MAKIIAEYDSETKEIKVTVNGQLVANVARVSMYSEKYEEECCYGYCDVETQAKTNDGVTTYTRMCAAKEDSKDFFDDDKTLALEKITEQDKIAAFFKNSLKAV